MDLSFINELALIANMSLILDLVLLIVFVFTVVNTARKGAFKAISGIGGTVGGLICGMMLGDSFSPMIYEVIIGPIQTAISSLDLASIAEQVLTAALPENIEAIAAQYIDTLSATSGQQLVEQISAYIADMIAPVLAFIAIFFVVKLAVTVVCNILSFDIPVLRTLNKMAGAILGAISGLVLIFALCWGILHFAPESGDQLNLSRQALRDSVIGGTIASIIE